jgi:threonine aldolase
VLNPTHKSFGSDNHVGVHPAVMAALARANTGDAIAYGDDETSRRARELLCAEAGAAQAFLVFNGTAANVLGISLLLRPYEGVICAETSHLNVDECGAAERVLGTKLLTVATPDGKLTPELIATRLTGRGDEHRVQARVVQIAQVTELGTCYSMTELKALQDFCASEGLRVYIDGARIANAVAYLGCSLADIAACADVLSFGGTKNGAMGVEGVLVMTEGLADEAAPYLRKQQMQLSSKMRFLSAQILGLLEDDVWRQNASRANAMAARLAAGLADVEGVGLAYPMESNGVFAEIGTDLAEALAGDWEFHVWSGGSNGRCVVRLMTAYDTSEADVDALLADIASRS